MNSRNVCNYPKQGRGTALAMLGVAMILCAGVTKVWGQGVLLTFDDLDARGNPHMPEIYEGLRWEKFSVLDGVAFRSQEGNISGYNNCVISARNVAYGWGGTGEDGSVLSGTVFNLNSGYIAAAWNDGLQLRVQGFVAGILAYENTYTLFPTSPSYIEFNYFGVDRVLFESSGGIPHKEYSPYPGSMYALDNLSVTIVPEPSAFCLGLVAVALAGRRCWSRTF